MPTLKTRPKYKLCWWCNTRLSGNSHRILRPIELPIDPVTDHCICANGMLNQGWVEVDVATGS